MNDVHQLFSLERDFADDATSRTDRPAHDNRQGTAVGVTISASHMPGGYSECGTSDGSIAIEYERFAHRTALQRDFPPLSKFFNGEPMIVVEDGRPLYRR
jgi:hypothetical protein